MAALSSTRIASVQSTERNTVKAFVFNGGRVVSAVYIEWQLFKRIDTFLALPVVSAARSRISAGLRRCGVWSHRV